MALRNIVVPKAEIQVHGETLSLRGLSFNDLLGLFYRRKSLAMDTFHTILEVSGREMSTAEQIAVIARSSPEMVGEVIALSSGSTPADDGYVEDVAAAINLPMGIQAEAVEKIAALTFTQDMPPGKVLALFMKMMTERTEAENASPSS